MKSMIWKLVGIVVLVFVVGIVLRPVCAMKDAYNKTITGDKILHNYEWFYDQYGQIKATEAKLKYMKEGSDDYVGTAMVLESMKEEYNSKSRMITKNLWKSKDLPYQF